MLRLILFWLVVITQQPSSKPDPIKILFIGNSLTYTNNLPELVEKLGEKSNTKIKTQMLAKPNFALEDHWNEGELQRLIKSGSFDFVVVQQGPSSQAEGRAMLFDSGEKIQALCKQHNSKLAFFMVWPARANYTTFDGVILNYTEVAAKTKALLCPVGKVWKEHFDATNDFSYYGPDQFHPSLAGSQVAAEIIYTTLITK